MMSTMLTSGAPPSSARPVMPSARGIWPVRWAKRAPLSANTAKVPKWLSSYWFANQASVPVSLSTSGWQSRIILATSASLPGLALKRSTRPLVTPSSTLGNLQPRISIFVVTGAEVIRRCSAPKNDAAAAAPRWASRAASSSKHEYTPNSPRM